MTDPYPTPFDGWPAPTCKNPSLTWCQTTWAPTSTPPASQTYSVPTTPAVTTVPATTTPPPATTTATHTVAPRGPELPVTGASAGSVALAGLLVVVFGIAMLLVAKVRSS